MIDRLSYGKAAGLKVKKGRPSIGRMPEKKELLKLYIKESKSIREVAEVLGCSKDMIYRSLKEYRIERRKGFKRSILRDYKPSYLRKEVKEKGSEQVAKELGITTRTLRKYTKKRNIAQG